MRCEVAVGRERFEIAGGEMGCEPIVELFRPVVDWRVLVGEVNGAEVVNDAAAAGDYDTAIAERAERLSDLEQFQRSGRKRLRNLDDRDVRVRQQDAKRNPESVIPTSAFFERRAAEERGDL